MDSYNDLIENFLNNRERRISNNEFDNMENNLKEKFDSIIKKSCYSNGLEESENLVKQVVKMVIIILVLRQKDINIDDIQMNQLCINSDFSVINHDINNIFNLINFEKNTYTNKSEINSKI